MVTQCAIDSARVLVTGHNGFIGSHYSKRYGGIPLIDREGMVDLCDGERVKTAVASIAPDAVLHLAAQSSVAESFENTEATFDINFHGTFKLLQALRTARFKGVLLFVGSADAYGRVREEDLPTLETQPLRPRSPYAVSKVAAEALCYQWSQTEDFRIVIARPFNQIGPGQDLRFALPNFAAQIKEIAAGKRRPELITGNIDVTRDFTDIRDTVRAFHMLMESGHNGEAYNICSGQEISMRSLLVDMLRLAGVAAELKIDPDRLRPNEQRRMVGSAKKIGDEVGWYPQIQLEKTLSDILNTVEKEVQ
jgi:GDP-4-dehydro-6-deoxy-D-mannose reductase